MEDLRIALGYERWNIRGHSYGTRYAQSYLREFPDRVRSAALSGLVPATLSHEGSDFYGLVHALRLLFDQCAADNDCRKAFPDIEKELLQLLERIKEKPIVLPPGTTDLLPRSSMILNPRALLGGIFQAMYSRDGIEIIPLFIHTVSQGKDWVAKPLASSIGSEFGLQNDMFHVIRCNDNPGVFFAPKPVFKDPLVDQLYTYWTEDQTDAEADLCQNLSIALDSLEQHPIHSDVPMLLFTGEFDPVTPTYNTDAVAQYVPNAFTFVVPGRGHDGAVPIPDLLADFFIEPNNRPDPGIIKSIEPVHFLGQVSLNEGISGLAVGIAKGDYLYPLVIGGVILLMLLSGFIYFAVYAVYLRLKGATQRIERTTLSACVGNFPPSVFFLFSLSVWPLAMPWT